MNTAAQGGEALYSWIMAYLPQSSQQMDSGQQLKSLPVILIALIGGLVSFAGLATYMAMTRGALMVPQHAGSAGSAAGGSGSGGGASDPTMILYVVSGLLTATSIAGFWGIGWFAVSSLRKNGAGRDPQERERLATMGLVTTSILRAAFAEGAGLFGAVLVLLTGTLYTLGAVAIAVVLIVLLLPVRSRLEALLAEAAR